MVVFIYLAVKLSRHTLPANGYWAAVVLTVAANLYALAQAALSIVSGNFTPTEYALVLESLLLFMTEIVMLVVMCNLISSLWSSFLQGRNRDPQSTGRHTSLGDTANQETALAPGGSLIVDFGSHRIEDHGYKADLRVNQSGNSQSLTIELSNDQLIGTFPTSKAPGLMCGLLIQVPKPRKLMRSLTWTRSLSSWQLCLDKVPCIFKELNSRRFVNVHHMPTLVVLVLNLFSANIMTIQSVFRIEEWRRHIEVS